MEGERHLSFSIEASRGQVDEHIQLGFLMSATKIETSYGLLNFGFGMDNDVLTGSLSMTDGEFWGLEEVDFTASLSASDESVYTKIGLAGQTRYGLSLDANANIDFNDPGKSTFSVSFSGRF